MASLPISGHQFCHLPKFPNPRFETFLEFTSFEIGLENLLLCNSRFSKILVSVLSNFNRAQLDLVSPSPKNKEEKDPLAASVSSSGKKKEY
jgi:hypothetical protein